MERVVVTRPFANICTIQVCAVDDATDDEILDTCNSKNPSGTSSGWSEVVREPDPDPESIFKGKNKAPVKCEDHEGRTHFLVLC